MKLLKPLEIGRAIIDELEDWLPYMQTVIANKTKDFAEN